MVSTNKTNGVNLVGGYKFPSFYFFHATILKSGSFCYCFYVERLGLSYLAQSILELF